RQRSADGDPVSDAELRQIRQLQSRDREVRQHEQAHVAAGGQYVTRGASFSYQKGPDGKRYAVGGEVGIDTSPESTPEATIRKMMQVRRAALAPAQPSATDRRVAAVAAQRVTRARMELRQAHADRNDQPSTGAPATATAGPGQVQAAREAYTANANATATAPADTAATQVNLFA
ncbi:MAG: putative metalloprotease CJM1_0395 family protein, partial [Planctomycetota bacterium]